MLTSCHRQTAAGCITWYHLVSSSALGFPKNPPTSAPTKGYLQISVVEFAGSKHLLFFFKLLSLNPYPAMLRDINMGSEIRRCSQLAALSPVQMGPELEVRP